MKRKIEAVEVRTTFKTDNWRGITDENGVFYNLNNPDLIKFIAMGGTYEIEFDEYVPTRGKYKGKTQNKITALKILSTVEQEEGSAEVNVGRTGEVAKTARGATSLPVPQGGKLATVQKQPTTVKDQIFPLIPTIGTIELTKEQEDILYADVDKENVEIRPDGLIYLPWMEYVSRLQRAFKMSWGTIPDDKPVQMGVHILWGFYLVIKGKLAGYAVGQQEYHANNPKMTWGDACEGAKSNALMRLCKGLGISLELWQPRFIKSWVAKYAEEFETKDRNGKKVKRWRKKNG